MKVSVACVPALGPAPPHAAQLVKDIWCTTLLLLVLLMVDTLETVRSLYPFRDVVTSIVSFTAALQVPTDTGDGVIV